MKNKLLLGIVLVLLGLTLSCSADNMSYGNITAFYQYGTGSTQPWSICNFTWTGPNVAGLHNYYQYTIQTISASPIDYMLGTGFNGTQAYIVTPFDTYYPNVTDYCNKYYSPITAYCEVTIVNLSSGFTYAYQDSYVVNCSTTTTTTTTTLIQPPSTAPTTITFTTTTKPQTPLSAINETGNPAAMNTTGLPSAILGLSKAHYLPLTALIIITIILLASCKIEPKIGIIVTVLSINFFVLVLKYLSLPTSVLFVLDVLAVFFYLVESEK